MHPFQKRILAACRGAWPCAWQTHTVGKKNAGQAICARTIGEMPSHAHAHTEQHLGSPVLLSELVNRLCGRVRLGREHLLRRYSGLVSPRHSGKRAAILTGKGTLERKQYA